MKKPGMTSAELVAATDALRLISSPLASMACDVGNRFTKQQSRRWFAAMRKAQTALISARMAVEDMAQDFAASSATTSLFCSECGCCYADSPAFRKLARENGLVVRNVGDRCLDQSGGVNTAALPCDGVLAREAYTDEVKQRQRRSLRRV